MSQGLPARITVFSTDFPYPPNRGGRADIWRRLLAMKRLGVAVQLVSFYDDLPGRRPTDEHQAVVMGEVKGMHVYPIRKGLHYTAARLLKTGRLPWHVACRTLQPEEQLALELDIQQFAPDCLWCEGPWCAVNAEIAARHLRLPLVYRSHNIEHLYMRRQAEAARSRRDRLAWNVACIGLQRFERGVIRRADWTFDISCDDLKFWQNKGVVNISWMPPLAEAALAPTRTVAAAGSVADVAFLGNLTTPNNVRGVEWLAQEIAPLVRAQRPETSFVIAGSNPGDHVRQVCAATGVTLLANPPDALAVYLGARVLVNPVRTGSGTHVKAIEMLMTAAPIVTSTQGTCGMPESIKRLFRVADSAPAFADQILEALAMPVDHTAERAEARSLFGIAGLADALSRLPAVGRSGERGRAPYI